MSVNRTAAIGDQGLHHRLHVQGVRDSKDGLKRTQQRFHGNNFLGSNSHGI